MESLSHSSSLNTPTPALTDIIDDCATPQTFLKMEDLHSSSPPAHTTQAHMLQNSPPPPVIVHSKPAKKRKSWGQELPEPKTSLPPRKRAKTEDEKEQRRIERIKRNRTAAHNSRERKRQETETLAVELAKVQAKLDAYEKLYGSLPAGIILPEVTLSTDEPDTPAPSLVESHGSVDHCGSPTSPSSLPAESFMIKQESIEPPLLSMSPIFTLDAKSASSHGPLDLTQHSAAMLCDLQCRSSGPSYDLASANVPWLTRLFLYLTILQFRTCYQTVLMALWSIMPSRMARWMQASTRRSTSLLMTSSKTQLLLRSMALAQHKAATRQPTSQGAYLALQQKSTMGSAKSMSKSGPEPQQPILSREALDRRKCLASELDDTGMTENSDDV